MSTKVSPKVLLLRPRSARRLAAEAATVARGALVAAAGPTAVWAAGAARGARRRRRVQAERGGDILGDILGYICYILATS